MTRSIFGWFCVAMLLGATSGRADIIVDTGNFSFGHGFTGFDGNTDPTNWETSDAANTSEWQGTNAGTSTAGGKYSYGDAGSGASFDGSLGFLPSSTRAINADIQFTNSTGLRITDFTVSYDAEHWRSAGDGRNNGWAVSYAIDGGSFIDLENLAYVASNTNPTGANPDGGPWESAFLSQTISGLSLENGSALTVRFFGDNGTGSGSRQGVAIDDFSFSSTAVPEPNSFAVLSLLAAGGCMLRRRSESLAI